MARVFVQHDRHGKILGIVSVRQMADDLPHPFHLVDAEHGVIEVAEDHAAFQEGLERVADTHVVDVAAGKLVPKGRRGKRAPAKPRKKSPSR
ncbi:MAG: hypothetical protein DMF86_03700 [Acidobacteria bacterium]|nr:MAG: hypothetical protein DMF86_03700 [Acidobacteriota bacterium]